ncbi:hypothetical protein B9Z19DRAFT_1082128 [Tuber borchii]|uniref:Uncharacterized protein n=1 Tax=Tuber borchii TaxID=42251 RepID=A0A2T6ZV65_TUBBO|nr:hypothetical protein B9Z19DRAFT_1082128 [Tuber borchii]
MCYQLLLPSSRRSPNHTIHPPQSSDYIYPTSQNLKNNPCFPERIGSLIFPINQFQISSSFLSSFLLDSGAPLYIHSCTSLPFHLNTFFFAWLLFVHTIILLPLLPFFSLLFFHLSFFFFFFFPFPSSLLHARWLTLVFSFLFLWFGSVRKYGFYGRTDCSRVGLSYVTFQ